MTHALKDNSAHAETAGYEELHLPAYASMLAAYHRAYAPELQAIIDELSLCPGDRVLDLACGDGTYTPWIARHIGNQGMVVAADISLDYLRLAQRHVSASAWMDRINVAMADVGQLPWRENCFDVVWCAQSLYDFSDALQALQEMRRVVRRGGCVVILENDRLHHLLLPWPAEFELALRQAELQALTRETRRPEKFYVGRRLRSLCRFAGLQPCRKRTYATNRQAPLGQDEQIFLRGYLQRLQQRVKGYLDPVRQRQLEVLIDPGSPRSLLNHPGLTVTCVAHLIWGVKP
jgi:ubiquinone/menaquinone biosynthesis C-methylase UbiE